ncbi:uncharacterized protein LOC132799645 [Ziziphus jujuba]|uniref:Uncharacterized protein LOC132799645 n=1 Tax=Ziziphus jujuba TaxID=326968 RepID=A0ABM3ZU85_ZIZJJ|nr:uncharacterized protein LOC132799645 [Ziziphus jujuba]
MYRGLAEAILRGETDVSSQRRRVILPSSFTSGARYMIQNYQDAMAICKWAGYPELFITLTCSPKWPEVVRFVESRGLKPEDRLDILCRIFKVKLDQLVKDLRQNKIFGKVKAVLKLTKNMRLQSIDSDIDKDELKAFSEWISSSGDGIIRGLNDGHAMIDIPDDLLIKDTEDSAASIVNTTYPSFSENINDPLYLQERAILAPTLDIVESINNYVSSLNRTEENTYLSSDATCRSDSNIDLIGDLHTLEFLNAIKCSGMPNHQLKLKVDVPRYAIKKCQSFFGVVQWD